jgi:glycosyltransferase involved in cell wall biosynthesis
LQLAVCILAKDEERTIGPALSQIARQSVLRSSHAIEVHVVVNGSTDATAQSAEALKEDVRAAGATLVVHDLEQAGKSRAWNKTVHELLGDHIDTALFMDADIELISEEVFEQLLETLGNRPAAKVCSGYPVKDLSRKTRKSPLDFFSLTVSRQSRHSAAINGSLYGARMSALREIWLPNETPGEDGFLNAMVTTGGFTHQPDPDSVVTLDEPTHFFKAHDVANFFSHERRMIVGTVINCWIFEHLWELKSSEPVGPLIRNWNSDQPRWVDQLTRRRIGRRKWLVPNEVMFGRLGRSRSSLIRWLAYLPVGVAATLLTVPPALMANRKLKGMDAASTW